MTEEQALNLLIDYLEGDLPPEKHQAVGRFFEQYPNYMASYKKASQLCRQVCQGSVPEGVGERLLQRLRQETASSSEIDG
mgnify:CR=1 FL=1